MCGYRHCIAKTEKREGYCKECGEEICKACTSNVPWVHKECLSMYIDRIFPPHKMTLKSAPVAEDRFMVMPLLEDDEIKSNLTFPKSFEDEYGMPYALAVALWNAEQNRQKETFVSSRHFNDFSEYLGHLKIKNMAKKINDARFGDISSALNFRFQK